MGGPFAAIRIRKLASWIWQQIMRIPPRLEVGGWLGLLIAGIGVESGGGEYLLGLMLLCVSSAALALLSARIKLNSSTFTNIARSILLGSAAVMLLLSFKWTYEIMGNNPWSHLLPRHDYKVTAFSHFLFSREDHSHILFYAKRTENDYIVTPVPLALFIRLQNLQSSPSRIVNIDFSFSDVDGSDVPIARIPDNFIFYGPTGYRLSFLTPFLTEKLRNAAIGPIDYVDGVLLFDTPANCDKCPYNLSISLKDVSGRRQRALIINNIDDNLSEHTMDFKVMDQEYKEDPNTWKIASFGEVVK